MFCKIMLWIVSCLMLYSTSVFAASTNLDGRVGAAHASEPEKYGVQLNFAYYFNLDPYFQVGIEPGFYWLKWDKTIGEKQAGGPGVKAEVKADTDAYTFPLMFDAQLRLPNLAKIILVSPYATVGVGYSFMLLQYSQPSFIDADTGTVYENENKTKFFSGLTWQFLVGFGFKPGKESKVQVITECGYRWAKLKNSDNLEIDISGLMFNIGVRYPFE